MTHSRRQFLTQSGAVGVSALGLRGRANQQSSITRIFVVPRVDEFENNYVGQWLQVTGTAEPHDQVADECEWADWEAGESTAYDALLLDRRSEAPLSIEMTAYGDSTQDEIRESTVFIINRAEMCGSEWVSLSAESVPRRAIVGEPAGPTVEESDGETSLGGLVAIAAVGVATALQLLRGDDEE
ncbi:hypothetical protein [Halobacterium wangiae]|uniref:hypothetical protein n=1 Tax=Halobacterium wangiae TaxID=2902623 RepID=UPI001E4A04B4|nr:hypothetical protein [Halobacterium wangiae]